MNNNISFQKVSILLLNWNNYLDTIECIESILKSSFYNYEIIIVDNGSSNDSIVKIKFFLSDQKLGYIEIDENSIIHKNDFTAQFILIKNKENYGFSKGINNGIKYILCQDRSNYLWLLNNDTIVDSLALECLLKDITKNEVYVTGSVILYYDQKKKIQSCGGRYYPFLASSSLYLKDKDLEKLDTSKKDKILTNINYIMGASILFNCEIFKKIGIFDEMFFVYVEEVDWFLRLKENNYKFSIALDSFVYHKDSASTKDRRDIFFYLLEKNNILFSRKHFPSLYLFPTITFKLAYYLSKGNFKAFKYSLIGIKDGLKQSIKK